MPELDNMTTACADGNCQLCGAHLTCTCPHHSEKEQEMTGEHPIQGTRQPAREEILQQLAQAQGNFIDAQLSFVATHDLPALCHAQATFIATQNIVLRELGIL